MRIKFVVASLQEKLTITVTKKKIQDFRSSKEAGSLVLGVGCAGVHAGLCFEERHGRLSP